MSNNAYIVSAVRTAGGKKNGRLSAWHPADLGAKVLDELVYRSGIKPELIDDVIFGCVDQVGAQSGNVARTQFYLPLCQSQFQVLLLTVSAGHHSKQFTSQYKQ